MARLPERQNWSTAACKSSRKTGSIPHIKCGEKVIVSYDRQEDRWTVLAADFTTRYQNLDVVTGVTLSINWQTQIYTLQYTTRQIQLPPWVTIGPPVQH